MTREAGLTPTLQMHVCRAELEHMHFYQVPRNADTTLLPGLCESLLCVLLLFTTILTALVRS